jgi:hypothetical protein
MEAEVHRWRFLMEGIEQRLVSVVAHITIADHAGWRLAWRRRRHGKEAACQESGKRSSLIIGY